MSTVQIFVRNETAAALPLDNLIAEYHMLPPGVDVELTLYNNVPEIQADPQLQQYVASGDCTLNDGTRDLSLEEALNVCAPVVSTASIYDFNSAPEKSIVHGNDLFLIEDSEDGFKKKKVKSEYVIFLGAGTIVYTPTQITETGIVYTKSKNPILLHGMETTIENEGNYEIEFSSQFACLKGWEIVLVAIFVDDTMIADTRRIIEAESYVAVQTEALIPNAAIGSNIHVRWWTDRGRSVVAEARSLKVRRYV